MIAVIRISGDVNITERTRETLFRMRIRRKYATVLLQPTKPNMKLLEHVRNFVAFGTIDNATLALLIEKRGQLKEKGKKLEVEKIINQIEKKEAAHWDIKPFFRLHPPRGGIDSKKHYGTSKKAVLGDNKEKINDLIRRML